MNRAARIMVVDDHKKSLELLEAVLISFGYRAVLAGSGREALDKARSEPPDLVLLDIMMPGLDGYQVTEELKGDERTRNIPVVMLTALQGTYDRIKALQAGADDFLTKPVHRKELDIRIRTLLKIKAYNDHVRHSSQKLKKAHAEKKAEIHAAFESFSRFVPREFLQCLGKKNIIDVQLGDQKLRELTVLFCDIRGFSSLSEKMTPQENFNFLNSYLKRMNPFIWDNKGFIDKYIGDAIMALFPESEESALSAAVEMLRYLDIYNGHRQHMYYDPISIGIGIHTGNVMIGIIGHETFMQGTGISDTVNTASHLEKLTKLYKVSLIVSRDIIKSLENPKKYSHRFLDRIKVKGKNKPVSIYEVFEADADEMKSQKLETRVLFESGVQAYHAKEFRKAHDIFEDLGKTLVGDGALEMYKKRCAVRLPS